VAVSPSALAHSWLDAYLQLASTVGVGLRGDGGRSGGGGQGGEPHHLSLSGSPQRALVSLSSYAQQANARAATFAAAALFRP